MVLQKWYIMGISIISYSMVSILIFRTSYTPNILTFLYILPHNWKWILPHWSAVPVAWNGDRSAVPVVCNGDRSAVPVIWNCVRSAVPVVWNGNRSAVPVAWNGDRSTVSIVWKDDRSAVPVVPCESGNYHLLANLPKILHPESRSF